MRGMSRASPSRWTFLQECARAFLEIVAAGDVAHGLCGDLPQRLVIVVECGTGDSQAFTHRDGSVGADALRQRERARLQLAQGHDMVDQADLLRALCRKAL